MKTGIIICCAIAVSWVVLAITQLWFAPLSVEVFVKLSITAGLIFIAVLVLSLVLREYVSEKKMRRDGYID